MLIGIDLGTSMIKAAAFSLDGEILAVASRRPTLRYLSTERIEQDFEEIVLAVGAVVSEVRATTHQAPIAVGITGQSDGLWMLAANGYAVRPAISWLDGRGNRPRRLHGRNPGVLNPPTLATLAMPIRIVFGSADRIIPARHMTGLPGTIAQHLFTGVGHMPQLEVKKPVARLLVEHLRAVG